MIQLDLADIQGNIHRPYGRFGFPYTRHFFFHIADPRAGRRFVEGVRPRITTAEPWASAPGTADRVVKPPITLNIGFTYSGLSALGLPTRTLSLLPDEFIDGMRKRWKVLGDVGPSDPEGWDPVWREPLDEKTTVHMWVSFSVGANADGSPLPDLDAWTKWLEDLEAKSERLVTMLGGHGAKGSYKWQDSAALTAPGPNGTKIPIPKEHFCFTDGISDPVFRGQLETAEEEKVEAIGGGKIAEGDYNQWKSWSALETGEFILGQVDEGQEFPVVTQPAAFARNGTFMVYRKLRQDVAAFTQEIQRQADVWKAVMGVADNDEAVQTVRAKMVGRWENGIPLTVAPNWAAYQAATAQWADCLTLIAPDPNNQQQKKRLADFYLMLTGFRYGDDLMGAKCPLGAHIRRANPRDMLDPKLSDKVGASTLTNRRRILRRGLPYEDPDGEKGVIFMAICSSLFRQFEFIQQQWMNYGLDFEGGNDTCPLIGNRASKPVKHVVPGSGETPTFIAADMPEFVATRGGDYFFLPSLSAVRMIAMGTVDPT